MTPEIESLLAKSQQSLQAAELLQADGYFNFAASRLYYAMFYVAQACCYHESNHIPAIMPSSPLMAGNLPKQGIWILASIAGFSMPKISVMLVIMELAKKLVLFNARNW